MRRLLFACCAVVLCRPAVAPAQTGPEPTMTLTLFGGASTGHSLWHIGAQPLCTLATCSSTLGPQYDTLDLTRDISSSIVIGAAGSYFRNPHVGIEGEIFFLGLPFDDSCRPVYLNADPDSIDQQVCDNISAASLSTSAISFSGGLVFRASPSHAISPYLRVGVGIVTYSGGTIEMSGAFRDATGAVFSRSIIDDLHPKTSSVSLQAAIGFTTRISPGYQFRLEARDAIVPLKRAVGAADQLGQAPTALRTYHRLILTMGLDVVLERKRGRRY